MDGVALELGRIKTNYLNNLQYIQFICIEMVILNKSGDTKIISRTNYYMSILNLKISDDVYEII